MPLNRTWRFFGVLTLLLILGASIPLVASTDRLGEKVDALLGLPERVYTRFFPPKRGNLRKLTAEEREAIQKLSKRLDAQIVWSSNRDGNHELYLIDLRSQEVRRLTHNPNVDFFSRFSPDGRRIVFLRSQREWVSFREDTAWDVYLINADGSGERLLVKTGYHPTWTADGRGILFSRGMQVFRFDLASGRESLVFDAKKEIPGVTAVGDFELSSDGTRLAMGIRGPFEGAAVWDFGRRALVPLTKIQACQTTWHPGDSRVVWVEIGGRGGTRVMWGPADGSSHEPLIDLPGDYSHEYFPKLSNDGRWLIWGAAAEGHEHDRADYEIFLWEVGTPWETAIRLTYYTGNDQWPDIYVNPAGASRP